MNIDELIGKECKYRDYLYFERRGKIVYVEDDYRLPNNEVFIYIEDEDDINAELPIYTTTKNINGKLIMFKYNEIRKSSEIEIM